MNTKIEMKCDNGEDHKTVMVEYAYGSKHRYDGVSEIRCLTCSRRVGRWCRNRLEDDEIEPRYCKGGEHPKA